MAKNILPLLTQRIVGTPLLIDPKMGDVLYSILEGRISVDALVTPSTDALHDGPSASRFVGGVRKSDGGRTKFVRVAGSTALITIDGALVNRGAWIGTDWCTGLVSYEGIAAQVAEAAGDKAIRSIVLDINSPGGEAAGFVATATAIRSARQRKRVVAFVNDVAASGAYALASAADEIVISPTSTVGAIGVFSLHFDRSGELAAKGVRPTMLFAGKHKVDGNPFGPLSDDVRANFMRRIETIYGLFIDTVSAGRGDRLTAARARATEADVYLGQDAITAGLADRIDTFSNVLKHLNRRSAKAAAATPNGKGSKKMTYDEETRAAVQAAVQAERERITAILESPAARGRTDTATKFALKTDMAAADAIEILETLPQADSLSSLAERASEGEEIGPGSPPMDKRAAIAAGWKKAFARTDGIEEAVE